MPTDVEATEEDEVLYGYDTYDVTQAQHNHQQLQQVIDNLEQQEEEDFHGFSDFEIQLAMDNKEKNMKRVNDIDRLLVKLRGLKRKRHDNVNKRAHPWVHQEWLCILDQDLFEEAPKQNALRQVSPSTNDNQDISYEHSESQHLSFDDDEFHSIQDAESEATASVMATLDISSLQDFNKCFQQQSLVTSTPTKPLKSVTDAMFLDKIPVVTSSESSLDEEDLDHLNVAHEKINAEIWDPPDLQQAIPQGPMRVERILNELHDQVPHIFAPEVGRVYNMDRILDGVNQVQDYPLQLQLQEPQQPISQQLRRSTRLTDRPDYKLLNSRGQSNKQ